MGLSERLNAEGPAGLRGRWTGTNFGAVQTASITWGNGDHLQVTYFDGRYDVALSNLEANDGWGVQLRSSIGNSITEAFAGWDTTLEGL